MKGFAVGGLVETICNEHTITDYLLAIKRITSPFARYYAHYYACKHKVNIAFQNNLNRNYILSNLDQNLFQNN